MSDDILGAVFELEEKLRQIREQKNSAVLADIQEQWKQIKELFLEGELGAEAYDLAAKRLLEMWPEQASPEIEALERAEPDPRRKYSKLLTGFKVFESVYIKIDKKATQTLSKALHKVHKMHEHVYQDIKQSIKKLKQGFAAQEKSFVSTIERSAEALLVVIEKNIANIYQDTKPVKLSAKEREIQAKRELMHILTGYKFFNDEIVREDFVENIYTLISKDKTGRGLFNVMNGVEQLLKRAEVPLSKYAAIEKELMKVIYEEWSQNLGPAKLAALRLKAENQKLFARVEEILAGKRKSLPSIPLGKKRADARQSKALPAIPQQKA